MSTALDSSAANAVTAPLAASQRLHQRVVNRTTHIIHIITILTIYPQNVHRDIGVNFIHTIRIIVDLLRRPIDFVGGQKNRHSLNTLQYNDLTEMTTNGEEKSGIAVRKKSCQQFT